jgi:hypothetical protein
MIEASGSSPRFTGIQRAGFFKGPRESALVIPVPGPAAQTLTSGPPGVLREPLASVPRSLGKRHKEEPAEAEREPQ